MGVLDDAIRDHLELKRRHGASDAEIARAEAEALGPARREQAVSPYDDPLAPMAEETTLLPPEAEPPPAVETPFDQNETALHPHLEHEPPPVADPGMVHDAPVEEPPLHAEPEGYHPHEEPPAGYDPHEPSAFEPHPADELHPDDAGAFEPSATDAPGYEPLPGPEEPHASFEPHPIHEEPQPVHDEPQPPAHDEPAGAYDPHSEPEEAYQDEDEDHAPHDFDAVPPPTDSVDDAGAPPVLRPDPAAPGAEHGVRDPDTPAPDPQAPASQSYQPDPSLIPPWKRTQQEPPEESADAAPEEPEDLDERAYREAAAAPPTEQFAPVDLDDEEFEDEPPRGRIRRWFSRKQSE